jgi:WD40 repeat protein
MWRLETGAATAQFAHPDIVTSVVFSPDGHRLATTCADGRGRLWDPVRQLVELTLSVDGEKISFLTFGTDGQTLVATAYDVHLFASDGHELSTFRTKSRATHATHIEDGRLLAVDMSGNVSVWRPPEPTLITTISSHAYEPHYSTIDKRTGLVAVAHNNEVTISGSNVLAKLSHGSFLTEVKALAFHACLPILAAAGDDAQVRLWNVHSGRQLIQLERLHEVRSLAWSGDMLAVAGAEGSVSVYSFDWERVGMEGKAE